VSAEEITPNSVEATLLWLFRQLGIAQEQLADLDEQLVLARCTFELAHAHAFLAADGPMDFRRYQAIVATEREKFAADVADQQVRKARERLKTLGTRAEIARSLRASVGSAMSLGNPGAA